MRDRLVDSCDIFVFKQVTASTKTFLTKKSFETLSKKGAQAGCSKESVPAAAPKVTMAKVIKVNTTFVNAVKIQTSALQRSGEL
jgi:hypothetical protein